MIDHWRKATFDQFILNMEDWYNEDNSTRSYMNGYSECRNPDEREYLNANFHLDKIVGTEYKYVLNKLLANKIKNKFTLYLLFTYDINIEVNSIDESGKSVLQLFMENAENSNEFNRWNLIHLFKRGYTNKPSDEQFLTTFYKNNIKSQEILELWYFARICYKLNDPVKIEKIFSRDGLIFSIVSFKLRKPIGINYPNLLGIANYAIQHQRQNGDILFKAMKHYKVYDEIKAKDKKGTFKLKEQDYNQFKPIQDNEVTEIVLELFPELKPDS